jgi:GTP cyclohydrolase II
MLIVRLAERPLRTFFGCWREVLYFDGRSESIALVYGDIDGRDKVPCRVHSACLSAHVFNSIECDCREQMYMAQTSIQDRGRGVVIWLDQDGRGNGHLALMLAAKLSNEQAIAQTDAYRQLGYPDDRRRYDVAGAILSDLSVRSIILLSNNPDKRQSLVDSGVEVAGVEQIALDLEEHPRLRPYYADKLSRGHIIGEVQRD